MMLRRILVALDFGAESAAVAQYAFDLARAVGAEVDIVAILRDARQLA